jgi:hypothetical protein
MKKQRNNRQVRRKAQPGFFTSRPETKILDTIATVATNYQISSVISTTATVTCLNIVALGPEIYQRVGRKIRMQHLQLKGQFFYSAATIADEAPRILIVYDRQGTSTGALPTYNDVITSQDVLGANGLGSWDFPNTGNRDRFKILHDRVFPFQTTVVGAGQGVSNALTNYAQDMYVNLRIPLAGLTAHYNDVGTAGNLPVTGQLLFITKGA